MTSKLLGEEVTLQQVEERLGPRDSWDEAVAEVHQRNEKPRAEVRLYDQDISSLPDHPKYVLQALLGCARRVLEAPRALFQGLRHGDVGSGFAYVGRPLWSFNAQGQRVPAPSEMVYVVYTDANGYVFDWDWVEADPNRAGYPVDWKGRFVRELDAKGRSCSLLGLPDSLESRFNPSQAIYSEKGDCVFAYVSDEPAYAVRASEDLTIFRSIQSRHLVGCKVKNVASIIETVGSGIWEASVPQVHVAMVVSGSYTRRLAEGAGRRPESFMPYSDVIRTFEECEIFPGFLYSVATKERLRAR